MNKSNQNTDNKFGIRISNTNMTNPEHAKSLNKDDFVVFDKSLKPKYGDVVLIQNSNNDTLIVLLQQNAVGKPVGVFINDYYSDVVVDVDMVVAVAIEATRYRSFNDGE